MANWPIAWQQLNIFRQRSNQGDLSDFKRCKHGWLLIRVVHKVLICFRYITTISRVWKEENRKYPVSSSSMCGGEPCRCQGSEGRMGPLVGDQSKTTGAEITTGYKQSTKNIIFTLSKSLFIINIYLSCTTSNIVPKQVCLYVGKTL